MLLAARLTGANRNDSQEAQALVDAIPHVRRAAGRPRQRPDCVLGDRGYDTARLRIGVGCGRGISCRGSLCGRTAHGSGPVAVGADVCQAQPVPTLSHRCDKRADIHRGVPLARMRADLLTVAAPDVADRLSGGRAKVGVYWCHELGKKWTRVPPPGRGSLVRTQQSLAEALRGRFTSHHASLLTQLLAQLDHFAALIDGCDVQISAVAQPVQVHIERLQTIVGVGPRSAQVIVSEVGVDMSRFALSAHLASGPVSAPGRTRALASAAVLGPGRGITGCERPSWNRPGPRRTPAPVIWCSVSPHQQTSRAEARGDCRRAHDPRDRISHPSRRSGLS